MTMNFAEFGLPRTIETALEKIKFTTPTPIQEQSIPLAMTGRDILGSAATGTGKTAAFAIPMLCHLIANPKSKALIMTPTRELAQQVLETIKPLVVNHKEITSVCLIGGEPMPKQLSKLKAYPRLIVGTPGRINDHLRRKSLRLDRADFLVLDETDRMLDMGFGIQIETIISEMAEPRQTLMFSATMPKEIVRLSKQYLNNPERIAVDDITQAAKNLKIEVIQTTEADKYTQLVTQLNDRTGSVIIFVKTKRGADRLAQKLEKTTHRSSAIHGDLSQRQRNRVIERFRDKNYRILVATDVAARGLDIPHIEHVINYDLPQVAEDYIHRIGRTARAGADGEALNLVTPADNRKWNAIVKLMDPDAKIEKHTKSKSGKRSSGGKKPFGKKPFGRNDGDKKPFLSKRKKDGGKDKPWSNKDRDDRPRSTKSNDDKPRSDRSRSDRSSSDGGRPERPWSNKFGSNSGKPRSGKPGGFKSRSEKSDRPRSDRSDKPRSDRSDRADRSDRPARSDSRPEGRSFDKPRSSKPRSDRARSDRPEGRSFDKPAGRSGKPSGKPKARMGGFQVKPRGKSSGKPGAKPSAKRARG